jgi:hypothetical protein
MGGALFLSAASAETIQTPAAANLRHGPKCKFGQLRGPAAGDKLGSAVTQSQATHYQLATFYVVPSGVPYEGTVHNRLVEATKDIVAWYQCASGGLTWDLAFPETVKPYFAQQTREYYRDHGDWWGSLLSEMASQGLPIWSPGTVTALWARGAGFWAGAAQGCDSQCGIALLGVEIFPEFNQPEWSGAECPADAVGGAAFPCTPVGAYAHELGHTVGLPHPYDFAATREFAFHSIMQTHWNYPTFAPPWESPWGFLTLERQVLRLNPFLHSDIDLYQTHADCDVVNLPVTGAIPRTRFHLKARDLTVDTRNKTKNATLFYWTFGDGGVSNLFNAVHTFVQPGTYSISLRASSPESMIGVAAVEVDVAADHHPGGGPKD